MSGSCEDPPPRPVFLHTGWRSRGTWIWAAFRAQPGVCAFYEPLHERLATISRPEIADFRPNSWPSGHGGQEAYFAEYTMLVPPDGRGVAGYQPRFAFDDFFPAPEHEEPALRAYLQRLLDAAGDAGQQPVLKFCRSMGRIGWLHRCFPDALHLAVLRDPWSQWLSARRQFTDHGNDYFLIVPFLVLCRNSGVRLVGEAVNALSVPMAPRLGRDLRLGYLAAERHVRRLSWADRHRGFLAFWALSAIAALRSGVPVVDAGALAENAADRAATLATISAAAGRQLALPAARNTAPGEEKAPGAADHDATAASWRFVRTALGALAPLADALPGAAAIPAAPPCPAAARNGALAAGFRVADAALYVAAKQLSYPVRRLHGEIRRRRAARAMAGSAPKLW